MNYKNPYKYHSEMLAEIKKRASQGKPFMAQVKKCRTVQRWIKIDDSTGWKKIRQNAMEGKGRRQR